MKTADEKNLGVLYGEPGDQLDGAQAYSYEDQTPDSIYAALYPSPDVLGATPSFEGDRDQDDIGGGVGISDGSGDHSAVPGL